MYLARLPAGSNQLQIYEVDNPVIASDRYYLPRAWAYRNANGSSEGLAALDVTPGKAAKRISAHRTLDNERRRLTQRPVQYAGAISIQQENRP